MNAETNPSPTDPQIESRPGRPARRPIRLAYLVSHPIQYQAPLLRRIAQEPGIELMVFFGSDSSVRGYFDRGFGVEVKWDTPLLEGYPHQFLHAIRDTGDPGFLSPLSYGLFHKLIGDGKDGPYDILWVHGYNTLLHLYGITCGKLARIPVITRSDSRILDRGGSKHKLLAKHVLYGLLGKVLDAVLTVGSLNAEYMSVFMGRSLPQYLLPYAVDNAWFQQQSRLAAGRRAELQAELNLDPARPVILFAAKFLKRKHADHMVAAYARLAPPGDEPAAYLVLVGDGEERANLERQVAATGLQSIRFAGFRNQSELPRFFDLATVFVAPAAREPWGLIVNEVMNAGRAVILSDEMGCAPDLVTDGVEGIVYKTGDIPALTDALRLILDTPGLAEAMGQRALARIDQFSFEQNIAGLHRALADLRAR